MDLFSGIGGFSLAAKLVGISTTQFVEINPYCQKVLAKNFPKVPIHSDVKTFTTRSGGFDLVTAGIPCQPHSLAGKRKGSADSRDLWGETFRVFCEARPKWLLLENVPGILSSNNGNFFRGILRDLTSVGYDIQWDIVSCRSVGGCHLRKRLWLIATHPKSGERNAPRDQEPQTRSDQTFISSVDTTRGDYGAVKPRVCRGNDGFSDRLVRPYLMPPNDIHKRLFYATDTKNRVDRKDRLMALGNAIVPEVAVIILKRMILSTYWVSPK